MRLLPTRSGAISIAASSRLSRSSSSIAAVVSISSLAGAALVGCGDPMPGASVDAGPSSGDASGDAGTCVAGGTGTLTIAIAGLPAGVAAAIVVTDSAGVLPVDSARTLSASPAGNYVILANLATQADPIVRTVYQATVSAPTFCLAAGDSRTVTVTYAPVPSSNKLWMTNQDSTSGELAAFTSSSLAATGAPAASVAAHGPAGRHLAFDRNGHLWAMGPTTVDSSLVRFAADTLGASGTIAPDREINVPSPCIPGLTDLAFDPGGNLWLTSACAMNVIRLTPADLAASGNVTPAVSITGLQGPDGVAVDMGGNLWVSDNLGGTLMRYDAGRLTASTSAAASLSITPQTATAAGLNPGSLAFDANGNLWVTNFGGNVIYELTPADLAGTGTKTVVPGVQMTVGAAALIESIAFDEGGGLWLTYSQGKVARIAPSQLTTSTNAGAPTLPQTVTTSADLAYANGLAFYPAPAALPLYDRLP